jgi:integrase
MNGIKQVAGRTGMQLFDAEGRRLYFTEEERRAFMAAAAKALREVRTFCAVLHATGCRVSEALALTPRQIDLSGRVIVFESLKNVTDAGRPQGSALAGGLADALRHPVVSDGGEDAGDVLIGVAARNRNVADAQSGAVSDAH